MSTTRSIIQALPGVPDKASAGIAEALSADLSVPSSPLKRPPTPTPIPTFAELTRFHKCMRYDTAVQCLSQLNKTIRCDVAAMDESAPTFTEFTRRHKRRKYTTAIYDTVTTTTCDATFDSMPSFFAREANCPQTIETLPEISEDTFPVLDVEPLIDAEMVAWLETLLSDERTDTPSTENLPSHFRRI